MKQTSLVSVVVTGLVSALVAVGCAAEETSDPVPVAIAIEFPSTTTAVVTQTVRVFVYDGTLDCSSLIALRKSERPLPASKVEQIKTPCDLQAGFNLDLPRNQAYTILVAGEVGDRDLLVGCSRQSAFGETEAVPVNLVYASAEFTLRTLEAEQPGSTSKCAKLSDKCANRCAP